MNEVNSAARPQKKRRSFLWLWILLLLFSFTGGIVLGLKLNTLPMPNDVKNRLYPVLEALIPGSTANRPQETAPETPTPVATPAPTETPDPVTATPSPVELPAVTIGPAPETSAPTATDALTGFEILEPEKLVLEDTARFETATSVLSFTAQDIATTASSPDTAIYGFTSASTLMSKNAVPSIIMTFVLFLILWSCR